MRKLFYLAIAITLCLVLSSCTDNNTQESDANTTVNETSVYQETATAIPPSTDAANQDDTETETVEEQTRLNDIILKYMKPTWLPDGTIETEGVSTITFAYYDYLNENNSYLFSFVQQPICADEWYVDSTNATVIDVNINGYIGTLITYSNETRINLFWNDGYHIFFIYSEALSYEEILRVAESVE